MKLAMILTRKTPSQSTLTALTHSAPFTWILALSAAALLVSLAPIAASAKAPNAAHQRMKDCNKKAKTDGLKGKARKAFMKGCLKRSGAKKGTAKKGTAKKGTAKKGTAKKVNPAHVRMRACNASAKKDGLKGAARKAFMKACLKRK